MKYRFNKKTKQYFVPVKAKTSVMIPKDNRKSHGFALSLSTLKRLLKARVIDNKIWVELHGNSYDMPWGSEITVDRLTITYVTERLATPGEVKKILAQESKVS